MVKDIWPGPKGSSTWEANKVGRTLFFMAWDRRHGRELWASDGTEAGTRLVKDINPGPERSDPGYTGQSFASADDVLYFTASDHYVADDSFIDELWRTDGTGAGTVMLKDLFPGGPGSYHPYWLVGVDNLLYFDADNGSRQLWQTDGTSAGTVMVRDIEAYPAGVVSSTLFLWVGDADGGSGLWTSDGTEEGTVPVKSFSGSAATDSIDIGGLLYLMANDGDHGSELWRSDGTTSGTVMVKDINPGHKGSDPSGFLLVLA
jgi:ELWxxDGT repeat protein